MALESERKMERSLRQGLFHGRLNANGNDPSLLWLFPAPSRLHAQRWDRVRRLLAARRRGLEYVLEEQPLLDADVHPGGRLASSAVGCRRSWKQTTDRCNSHLVWRPVRHEVPGSILDRRRRDG